MKRREILNILFWIALIVVTILILWRIFDDGLSTFWALMFFINELKSDLEGKR